MEATTHAGGIVIDSTWCWRYYPSAVDMVRPEVIQ